MSEHIMAFYVYVSRPAKQLHTYAIQGLGGLVGRKSKDACCCGVAGRLAEWWSGCDAFMQLFKSFTNHFIGVRRSKGIEIKIHERAIVLA
jgi:hypothetical protein